MHVQCAEGPKITSSSTLTYFFYSIFELHEEMFLILLSLLDNSRACTQVLYIAVFV